MCIRDRGTVHRHRDAHLVERDAVEQLTRIVDRVDRHTGHADVADDARIVRVIAAVRGQVERDRQSLLACRQVAAVERIGLLGGGEARILADCPWLGRVHRRVGAAQERAQPRVGVERVEAGQVGGCVEALDLDAFGRSPGLGARGGPLEDGGVHAVRLFGVELESCKRGGDAHAPTSVGAGTPEPKSRCSRVRCPKARASTPVAAESSMLNSSVGLPARMIQAAPSLRSAAIRSAPHWVYAASVPARHTTGEPSYALTTSSTPAVAPAATVPMPAAANRLVTKLARAVWAAMVPIVARKTGLPAGSSRSASKGAP